MTYLIIVGSIAVYLAGYITAWRFIYLPYCLIRTLPGLRVFRGLQVVPPSMKADQARRRARDLKEENERQQREIDRLTAELGLPNPEPVDLPKAEHRHG